MFRTPRFLTAEHDACVCSVRTVVHSQRQDRHWRRQKWASSADGPSVHVSPPATRAVLNINRDRRPSGTAPCDFHSSLLAPTGCRHCSTLCTPLSRPRASLPLAHAHTQHACALDCASRDSPTQGAKQRATADTRATTTNTFLTGQAHRGVMLQSRA